MYTEPSRKREKEHLGSSSSSFKPLKLFLDKHHTWKMCFLLDLALAKRVSELHDFSYWVRHLHDWRSCTFSFLPDFVAMTQNLAMPDPGYDEFSVPSLVDFAGGYLNELLLCPIRALWKYLLHRSSFVLVCLLSLSLPAGGINRCPETLFLFGFVPSFTMPPPPPTS